MYKVRVVLALVVLCCKAFVTYMICICIYVFLYVKTRLNRYELTHLEQALVRDTEYRVHEYRDSACTG